MLFSSLLTVRLFAPHALCAPAPQSARLYSQRAAETDQWHQTQCLSAGASRRTLVRSSRQRKGNQQVGFTFIAQIICAKSAHSRQCFQPWSNSNWGSAQWEQAFYLLSLIMPSVPLDFPSSWETRRMLCVKEQRAPVRRHPASLSFSQLLVLIRPIGFPGNFAMATNTFVLLKKKKKRKKGQKNRSATKYLDWSAGQNVRLF